jgi:hypothetical protein
MNSFTVFVDSKSPSFQQQLSAGGNILCNFYIRLGRDPFPADPWLDFPVIVLTWWLLGLVKLLKAEEPVENDFMNGPYSFMTELKGDEVIITRCKRGVVEVAQIGIPIAINSQEYKEGLVESAVSLIGLAYTSKGRDWDSLRAAIRSVSSL